MLGGPRFNFEERQSSPQEVALLKKNEIQIGLAIDNFGEKGIGKWIELHAENFAKIWDQNLADRYDRDPEKTLEEITVTLKRMNPEGWKDTIH